MPHKIGTRRALLKDTRLGFGDLYREVINDPDAILAYFGQDTTDNGVIEAWNVGFGMPDGTEVVTNGTFDTDTDWTKGDAAITISGGKANWSGAQAGNADLTQTSILTAGEVYAVTFTISGRTAGTLQPLLGTTAGTAQSTNATFTVYHAANNVNLVFRGNSTFDGKLDDVSIEKVTTGRNLVQNPFFDTDTIWTKGNGSSIAGGKLVIDGSQVATEVTFQSSVVSAGIEYDTIFKLSGYVAGTARLVLGSTAVGIIRNADGIYRQRITAGSVNETVSVLYDSTFQANIEFVIVRPVSNATNGRYAPNNLVLNPFMYYWTAGVLDGWGTSQVGDATSRITESPAGHARFECNGVADLFINQAILAEGKHYVVDIHVSDVTSGALVVYIGLGNVTQINSAGVHRIVGVATAGNANLIYIARKSGVVTDITIDYVRVEQILIEPSSSFSDYTTNPLAGTATAITIGAAGNANVPRMLEYNALTSIGDLYSVETNALLPRTVGTVFIVGRSDTWAAGIDYLMAFLMDANNGFYAYRTGTNLVIGYDAGGTAEEVTIASGSPTGLFMVGFSYDVADGVIDYFNGSQTGAKQTIAGEMVGNLASTTTCMGDSATTPTGVWDGGLACLVWFDTVKTAAEMLTYAQLTGVV